MSLLFEKIKDKRRNKIILRNQTEKKTTVAILFVNKMVWLNWVKNQVL